MRQSSNSISFRLARFVFAVPGRTLAAIVGAIRKATAPLPVARVKFVVEEVADYPADVLDDCDPIPGIPARVTEVEETLYRKDGRRYLPVDVRLVSGTEPLYRKCGTRYKGV